MSDIGYGDQKQILVGVTLHRGYECYGGRPSSPKLTVHWFADLEQYKDLPEQFRKGNCVYGVWNERCSFWEVRKEETLPDQVFILVTGQHDESTSWFATEACTTREAAEAKAKENEKANHWWYVVQTSRFVPPTQPPPQ